MVISERIDPAKMHLRSGTDYSLEEQTNQFLAERCTGQRDYLSQDQLDLRANREISNHLGVADASLVQGHYRRAYNPLAGSRPGKQGRGHDDG